MRYSSFNNHTFVGGSIMVIQEKDDFDKLLEKASQKANELNFKKLVLKSLRIDIENKDDRDIENIYDLYMTTIYGDC